LLPLMNVDAHLVVPDTDGRLAGTRARSGRANSAAFRFLATG
jgi:hypothetical protein